MINKSYGNMAKTCVMIDLVDFTINKQLKVNTRSDIQGLPLDEPCIFTVSLWCFILNNHLGMRMWILCLIFL